MDDVLVKARKCIDAAYSRGFTVWPRTRFNLYGRECGFFVAPVLDQVIKWFTSNNMNQHVPDQCPYFDHAEVGRKFFGWSPSEVADFQKGFGGYEPVGLTHPEMWGVGFEVADYAAEKDPRVGRLIEQYRWPWGGA